MYVSWEDHGQGADMGTLVSAHETLRQAGITPEQIHLVMNDTKVTPNSGPAGGSRSQVMTGNACRLAAENLLAAMKKDDGTYRTYDEMVAEGIETKVLSVGCDCLRRSSNRPGNRSGGSVQRLYVHALPARGLR